MGEFKKGDFVRAKRDINGYFDKGALYQIARAIGKSFVLTDNDEPSLAHAKHHTDLPWLIENFDLVTIKLEEGKFYKTRDGRKVGPIVVDKYHDRRFGWSVEHEFKAEFGKAWRSDGTFHVDLGTQHNADIIAEWIDEPAAKASNDNAQPKFKVGDRVVVICNKTNGGDPIEAYVIGDIYPITSIIKDLNGNDAVLLNNHYQYLKQGQFAPESTITTTIVALIENGQPKPSSTPHVHTSADAAEKEAKRLAAKYKGKQFGVFTLTTTHEEAAPVYDHKWQNLAALGLKIDAVKELRALSGLGLKSAKDAVEHFLAAA